MTASLVLDAKATLGEGAIWDAVSEKLYWVDIVGCELHVYDPVTKRDVIYPTKQMVGTVVPAGHDKVLLAMHDGIATMALSDGKIEYKIKTIIHHHNKRFNDGKCDPQGRFWVGSLTLGNNKNDNKLYCITRDFDMVEKAGNIGISNGIAWSADSTKMYHIDTPSREVTSYDFDPINGDIANKQLIITIPGEMGYPDGMTIDSEGMLWIALWDGFCVIRCDPENGQILQKIAVPAPKVTSCAFGGKDLKQLFITTASCEMSENELIRYPLSGGLFVVDPGVNGFPSNLFR